MSPKNWRNNGQTYSSGGPHLPITAFPDYIMFGTFRAEPKSVEFREEGLRIINVAPNKANTKFKYHIMIPFVEMQTIDICTDSTQPIICLKPNRESTDKIQECMCLGHNSKNGLKFDTDSDDPSEQRIIIVFTDEKMTEEFAKIFFRQCLQMATECECKFMDAMSARMAVNAARVHSIKLETKPQRLVAGAEGRLPALNPSPLTSDRYHPYGLTPNPVIKREVDAETEDSSALKAIQFLSDLQMAATAGADPSMFDTY